MQGGDISNGSPPRVLVHLDVIVQRQPEISKFLGIVPVVREKAFYDRLALNQFWLFTSRHGVTLELFDIGCSQSDMDQVMDDIDRIGTNPFRWGSGYESLDAFMHEFPYRPEVIGVVDLPERALQYGSKYFDLARVT